MGERERGGICAGRGVGLVATVGRREEEGMLRLGPRRLLGFAKGKGERCGAGVAPLGWLGLCAGCGEERESGQAQENGEEEE